MGKTEEVMTPAAGIFLLILSLISCMILKLDLVYGLLAGMFAIMAVP